MGNRPDLLPGESSGKPRLQQRQESAEAGGKPATPPSRRIEWETEEEEEKEAETEEEEEAETEEEEEEEEAE